MKGFRSTTNKIEWFQIHAGDFNFEKDPQQLADLAVERGLIKAVEGKEDEYQILDNTFFIKE